MPTTSNANAATCAVYVGQHVRIKGGPHYNSEGRVVSIARNGWTATVQRDEDQVIEPIRFLISPTD